MSRDPIPGSDEFRQMVTTLLAGFAVGRAGQKKLGAVVTEAEENIEVATTQVRHLQQHQKRASRFWDQFEHLIIEGIAVADENVRAVDAYRTQMARYAQPHPVTDDRRHMRRLVKVFESLDHSPEAMAQHLRSIGLPPRTGPAWTTWRVHFEADNDKLSWVPGTPHQRDEPQQPPATAALAALPAAAGRSVA